MDGEFLVVDWIGVGKGVVGGNLIIEVWDMFVGLSVVKVVVDEVIVSEGVIFFFLGGVVCSGSKVGLSYKGIVVLMVD